MSKRTQRITLIRTGDLPTLPLLQVFDNALEPATLDYLTAIYAQRQEDLALKLSRAKNPVDINTQSGSIVYRAGRIDAVLTTTTLAPLNLDLISKLTKVMYEENGPSSFSRDVRGLFVISETDDQPQHIDFDSGHADIKPSYLTIIVALDDVEDGMGDTMFVIPKGGFNGKLPNYKTLDEKNSDIVPMRLKKNQALVFDGRILHFGGAAKRTRVPLVYYVLKNNSLVDVNVV